MDHEREPGGLRRCQIRRWTAAGLWDSGELFWQPGGTILRGKKGKMERRGRSLYRHRLGSKRAGSKGNWWGGVIGLRRDLRSREEEDLVLTRGSHWSVRKGGRTGYRFGIVSCWAVGQFWCRVRWVPRGPFLFLFLFFFSSFLLFPFSVFLFPL
jgi:hypothetical protein